MNLIFFAIISINFQIGFSQIVEPILLNVTNSIFDISQRDMNLVLKGNKKSIDDRLSYLAKHDSVKYSKLLKFINYNDIRLDLLNKYILSKKCANFIIQENFPEAEKTLKNINFNNYNEVINQAYSNDSNNFFKILDFANSIYDKNDNKTITIYKLLLENSKENELPENLLDMVKFIDERFDTAEWTQLKEYILSEICETIVNDKIHFYVINHNLNLIYEIQKYDHLMALKLLNKAVANSCENLQADIEIYNLLQHLNTIPDLYLTLEAYNTFYDSCLKNLDENSNYFIKFSNYLQNIFKDNKLDHDTKIKLIELAAKLPKQIKETTSSEKCIRNVASGNFLKVSNKDSEPIFLSPDETAYKRTKWILHKTNFFYYRLENVYSNSFINIKNLTDTTDDFDILCQINLDTSYSYIKTEFDDYLRDDEGILKIGTTDDEFAQWNIQDCYKRNKNSFNELNEVYEENNDFSGGGISPWL